MHRFTTEEELEIINYYLIPKSIDDIAEHFDFPISTAYSIVKKLLKKYEVPRHSKEITDKLKQEARVKTNLKKYGTPYYNNPEKFKATMLEKYGVENPSQLSDVKIKKEETVLKHYGVKHPFQADTIKEKIKQTSMERYGAEFYTQTVYYKERVKKTCNEKYGKDNYNQTAEAKERLKKTCLEKYGVDNPSKCSEFHQKKIATSRKNWGVDYAWQCVEIKEKRKETNLEKYGFESVSQSPEIKEKMKKTNLEKYGVEHYAQWENAEMNRRHICKINDVSFDSFPELCFYLYYHSQGIDISRPKECFNYTYNGILHYYHPDFKIGEVFYEIKGDHFLTSDGTWCNPFDHSQDELYEAKHQCALANNVVILYSEDQKKYTAWFFKNNYKQEDFFIKK